MKLSHIFESRKTSRTVFKYVPRKFERILSKIDVAEVNENRAQLLEVSPQQLLSRETEVYDDTVADYQKQFIKTGCFDSPSGYTDESYYPWGIQFGDYIVIMDGTHRCQAQLNSGANKIKIHVFQRSDFG